MNKKQDIATAVLGAVVALILWVTILSREVLIGRPIAYYPFHALVSFVGEIQKGRIGANFIGNIVLFIPVGLLFPIVTRKWEWLWTLAIGCGFSVLIEITQLMTNRGCFDLDDIILNTIGATIGYCVWMAVMFRKLVDKRDKASI